MVFRPLELSLNMEGQTGFTVCSFSWEDDSMYSLVGLIVDREYRYVYISLAFFGCVIVLGED